MGVYGRFAEEAGTGDAKPFNDADRIPQRVFVGDVDDCVDELTSFIHDTASPTWSPGARRPGSSPRRSLPSMERFAAEVVPQVRSRLIQG